MLDESTVSIGLYKFQIRRCHGSGTTDYTRSVIARTVKVCECRPIGMLSPFYYTCIATTVV